MPASSLKRLRPRRVGGTGQRPRALAIRQARLVSRRMGGARGCHSRRAGRGPARPSGGV